MFSHSAPALPTLVDTGIEPTVTLGMFQEMLTGRTLDDQLDDPESRPIVADRANGQRMVIRIGDDLVAPLVDTPPDRLRDLAQPWSEIEEFWGRADPADLYVFLSRLQELAQQGHATGQRLYCWVCV